MEKVATGVAGLDKVLEGGVTAGRLYLVEGDPGAGKTTLAMQFLREGARLGEQGLYIGLSETRVELLDIIASHGWEQPAWEVRELGVPEEFNAPDSQYTIFQPAEVELGSTTQAILEAVGEVRPKRLVIDSLSEMRLLAQSSFRLRRQILALKQFLASKDCTTFLIDDRNPVQSESQVQTIVHGVVTLEHLAPEFGAERRRLEVKKLRGQSFAGGYHDFRIATGGIQVYPRLVAAGHTPAPSRRNLASGIASLDALLGGGLDFGTSTLLMGPTGAGKSSLATQYTVAAVAQGIRAAAFTFDETEETYLRRAEGMNLDLREAVREGKLELTQIDPAQMSPGEFAACVVAAVDRGARLVVIDSLNGYLNAMPEERFLTAQLHELLTYMGSQGVATLLLMAQTGVVGPSMQSPVDASYLADSIVLFRYYEAFGGLHKAISVLKRRIGPHEETIRELSISAGGLSVGAPLKQFHGVLLGVPNLMSWDGS